MRKTTGIIFSLLATITILSVALSSCKDNEPPKPPTLSFASATMDVKESDGTIEIEIKLDKAAKKNIIVEYSIEGSALDVEAAGEDLAPDYEIVSEYGEVEIEKGQTSGIIEINLFSDAYYEEAESIELKIESVDEGIELTRDDEIEITVNQEDGLLVLLEWGVNPGESYTDVDMDLFLWAENASSDLEITNFASARGSFASPEYFFLPSAIPGENDYGLRLPNGSYGLSCNYYSGTKDPMNFRVRFIKIVNSDDVSTVTKTGVYHLANINAWDETDVNPLLAITFEKSGTEFTSFSEINVNTSGSREKSSSIPIEIKKGESSFKGVLNR